MWQIAGKTLTSRLFLGTAQYPSMDILQDAVTASEANVITVSLRRQSQTEIQTNSFWQFLRNLNCHLLPNTAGCFTANEAVMVAEMSREIFQTNWIKLEVIGDDYNLQPDPFELVTAAEILVNKGFEVFPYCTDDLVLCQRLVEVGCKILMPWAAPIGSGKGIINPYALEVLRARLPNINLLVDAGIGKPSDATQALEMGFDGVLLNTAVALAQDPVQMARAFKDAVRAGRHAYEAGTMPEREVAHPSTSLVDTPFWHQEKLNTDENIVWTIAGSDPSGAAGLQADLKTLNSLGVHGCSIVSAVTVQNRQTFVATGLVPSEQVKAQINLLQHDLTAKVVKIGMVGSIDSIQVVKDFLTGFNGKVVLDPVLISTSGKHLFDEASENYISALRSLFPYITLLTPNLLEAERILHRSIQTYEEVQQAAKDLLVLGVKSVLIKGGHASDTLFSQDYWTNGVQSYWLASKRRVNQHYRGTGCTMASAIAAALAYDYSDVDAIVIGKMYVNQAMRLAENVLLAHVGWPEQQIDLPYLSSQPLQVEPTAFATCEAIGLYPIVDSITWLKKLLPLGVKTIQLRIKNKTGNELEQEIAAAVLLAKEYHAQLFINDYWELAVRYGAFGVHLGQEDIHSADIEGIRKAGLRLGISTHCYAEVARAHALNPSYIACGPIYSTTSKIMTFAPQGIINLQRWRKLLNYPLVAIGGIDLERIPAILATGVEGIALISAITNAQDPLTATIRLLEKTHQIEGKRYVA